MSVEHNKARQRGKEFQKNLVETLARVDIPEAVAKLGCSTDKIHEYVAAGDLIAIEYSGRTKIPSVLLPDGHLVPGLREVVRAMDTQSPWIRLIWLISPNERLSGRTPLASIGSDHEEVLLVARGVGVQGGA